MICKTNEPFYPKRRSISIENSHTNLTYCASGRSGEVSRWELAGGRRWKTRTPAKCSNSARWNTCLSFYLTSARPMSPCKVRLQKMGRRLNQ